MPWLCFSLTNLVDSQLFSWLKYGCIGDRNSMIISKFSYPQGPVPSGGIAAAPKVKIRSTLPGQHAGVI